VGRARVGVIGDGTHIRLGNGLTWTAFSFGCTETQIVTGSKCRGAGVSGIARECARGRGANNQLLSGTSGISPRTVARRGIVSFEAFRVDAIRGLWCHAGNRKSRIIMCNIRLGGEKCRDQKANSASRNDRFFEKHEKGKKVLTSSWHMEDAGGRKNRPGCDPAVVSVSIMGIKRIAKNQREKKLTRGHAR